MPARVVQWLNHLGTMCSTAWRAQWPWSGLWSLIRATAW